MIVVSSIFSGPLPDRCTLYRVHLVRQLGCLTGCIKSRVRSTFSTPGLWTNNIISTILGSYRLKCNTDVCRLVLDQQLLLITPRSWTAGKVCPPQALYNRQDAETVIWEINIIDIWYTIHDCDSSQASKLIVLIN